MNLSTRFASAMLAAFVLLPPKATAQEFTGDKKLACEAILCLASPTRPQECAASLTRYFSISLRRFWDTVRERKNFLSLCPQGDAGLVDKIVNQTTLEQPDEPESPAAPARPGRPQSAEELKMEMVHWHVTHLIPATTLAFP